MPDETPDREPIDNQVDTEGYLLLEALADLWRSGVIGGHKFPMLSIAREKAAQQGAFILHNEEALLLDDLRKRYRGGSTFEMLRDAYINGEE